MDEYKEITSTLEGRLSLRNGKAVKQEISDEDYFESRVEPRPTVNSWISGRAIPDFSTAKTKSVKPEVPPSEGILPRFNKSSRVKPIRSHSVAPPHQTLAETDAFTLSVNLAEPVLYLEGFDFQHRTAHTSTVLRGFVQLQVLTRTAFNGLSLRFEGISLTIWPESWRLRHLKKNLRETIIEQDWNFVGEGGKPKGKSHSPQYLDQGTYTYSFELPIDPALPETIKLPLGSVSYTLTATASHGNNVQSTTCSQEVLLVRIPCPCSLETVEPCGAQGFQHGLRYNLMLHAQSFPVGGHVTMGVRLMPSDDCAWQRISISLEEDIRYRTRDGLAKREQLQLKGTLYEKRAAGTDDLASRALRQISSAGESMSNTYAGAANIEKPRRGSETDSLGEDCLLEKAVMKLPTCSIIHPDTAYSCIYVRHNLAVWSLPRCSMTSANEHP